MSTFWRGRIEHSESLERRKQQELKEAKLLKLLARPTISTEKFINLLDKHDWHYESSADDSAYKRGLNQRKIIFRHMDSCPKLRALYYEYQE